MAKLSWFWGRQHEAGISVEKSLNKFKAIINYSKGNKKPQNRKRILQTNTNWNYVHVLHDGEVLTCFQVTNWTRQNRYSIRAASGIETGKRIPSYDALVNVAVDLFSNIFTINIYHLVSQEKEIILRRSVKAMLPSLFVTYSEYTLFGYHHYYRHTQFFSRQVCTKMFACHPDYTQTSDFPHALLIHLMSVHFSFIYSFA